jgi:hypothetical protein
MPKGDQKDTGDVNDIAGAEKVSTSLTGIPVADDRDIIKDGLRAGFEKAKARGQSTESQDEVADADASFWQVDAQDEGDEVPGAEANEDFDASDEAVTEEPEGEVSQSIDLGGGIQLTASQVGQLLDEVDRYRDYFQSQSQPSQPAASAVPVQSKIPKGKEFEKFTPQEWGYPKGTSIEAMSPEDQMLLNKMNSLVDRLSHQEVLEKEMTELRSRGQNLEYANTQRQLDVEYETAAAELGLPEFEGDDPLKNLALIVYGAAQSRAQQDNRYGIYSLTDAVTEINALFQGLSGEENTSAPVKMPGSLGSGRSRKAGTAKTQNKPILEEMAETGNVDLSQLKKRLVKRYGGAGG